MVKKVQTTNVSANILDPNLKAGVDTFLLNNQSNDSDYLANTTSKEISKWRWQRIGLLIATLFIGYGLFYFFKQKGQKTRNIFKALFTLPSKEEIKTEIKTNGVKIIEVEVEEAPPKKTKRRREGLREKRMRAKRLKQFGGTQKNTGRRESISEVELEVSLQETKEEDDVDSSELFKEEVETVDQEKRESEEADSLDEASFRQPLAVSQALRQRSGSFLEEVSKGFNFEEPLIFCQHIGEGKYLVQKSNRTIAIIDKDNQSDQPFLLRNPADVMSVLVTERHLYVATRDIATGARKILQFDKKNLGDDPAHLLGLNSDVMSMSVANGKLYVVVEEYQSPYLVSGESEEANLPAKLITYSTDIIGQKKKITSVPPDKSLEKYTTEDGKYSFIAQHYPDEDHWEILRYSEEEFTGAVVPQYSTEVFCREITGLNYENNTLLLTTDSGVVEIKNEDFEYTAGKRDVERFVETDEIIETKFRIARPEDEIEINHTGHLVALSDELVAISNNNVIEIWPSSSVNKAPLKTLHNDLIDEITCLEKIDGNLVAGSNNGVVILWDLDTDEERIFMASGEVSAIAVSSDGNYIAAATKDGDVFVWKANTAQKIRKYNAGAEVTSMNINDAGELSCIVASKAQENEIPGVTVINDSLITVTKDGLAILWNHETGVPEHMFEASGEISSMAASLDRNYIAAQTKNNQFIIWDARTAEVVREYNANEEEIPDLTMINGNLVIISKDGTATLLDRETGHQRIFVASGEISSMQSSLSGNYIAAQTKNDRIIIWDASTAAVLHEYSASSEDLGEAAELSWLVEEFDARLEDIGKADELSWVGSRIVKEEIPGVTWINEVKTWKVPELAVKKVQEIEEKEVKEVKEEDEEVVAEEISQQVEVQEGSESSEDEEIDEEEMRRRRLERFGKNL